MERTEKVEKLIWFEIPSGLSKRDRTLIAAMCREAFRELLEEIEEVVRDAGYPYHRLQSGPLALKDAVTRGEGHA